MRAYKVTTGPTLIGTVVQSLVHYAGTQDEARGLRREWALKYELGLKDVTIEEVEIPTSKAALLAFINGVIDG